MKSIAKALVLIASLACVVPNAVAINYSHSNIYTTDQQFAVDRYQCARETQQRVTLEEYQQGFSAEFYRGTGTAIGGATGQSTSVVIPNCGLFYQCLTARGYTRLDAGSLWVDPLQCFDANRRRFDFR